ncbi:MAG: MBL fold metallo-hydrolase [Anaerolineae bacterium]|nr:MAG: MBL fold metallo-hydrolase [Anaerolineae bacterium]
MNIKFLGAARTVTGSLHVLTVNGHRILLECGLYQGRRQESFERNRQLPFDPTNIDAMILSHAHIDHSGNIPMLVKNGYQGNIYVTPATRDLCSAMLRDAAYIQEQDAAYLNKKRKKTGEPPIEPLYKIADALNSLQHFVSVGYERPFPVVPGVTATLHDAGHILGSAIVALDVEEGERKFRFAFSGDLGRRDLPILRDPTCIEAVDAFITESTYGDRFHGPPAEADVALRRAVNETFKRGGKVIIPAFSVGRTQEIVYALHRLSNARKIPDLPIFVDSPLSTNVTEIFRLHPECYDKETHDFLNASGDRDPFGFHRMRYIREVEDSKALNFLREPAVIISASGMCENGRILHHLKNNVKDARNTVLIVGWQAPHTLGRRLVEKDPVVRIFGQEYSLRANVEVINGFSAHADRNELLAYTAHLSQFDGRLKHVFVVHGEEKAAQALARGLREQGVPHVLVPEPGQEVEL